MSVLPLRHSFTGKGPCDAISSCFICRRCQCGWGQGILLQQVALLWLPGRNSLAFLDLERSSMRRCIYWGDESDFWYQLDPTTSKGCTWCLPFAKKKFIDQDEIRTRITISGENSTITYRNHVQHSGFVYACLEVASIRRRRRRNRRNFSN